VSASLFDTPDFKAADYSFEQLLGAESSAYAHYLNAQDKTYSNLASGEGKAVMTALVGGNEKRAEEVLQQLITKEPAQEFVMGPSGSGGRFLASGLLQADALVHGKRRWFFMTAEDVKALRMKALDDFAPASAFVFFEEQLEELMEEHGLRLGKDVVQCEQEAGDVILVPAQVQSLALAMVDSFSYREHIIPTEGGVSANLAALVEKKVWAPTLNVFDAAACVDQDEWGALGGFASAAHLSQLKMAWPLQVDDEMTALMALKAVLLCGPLLEVADAPSEASVCSDIFEPCSLVLGEILGAAGHTVPHWLVPRHRLVGETATATATATEL